jgi:hypothetical protein
LSAVVEVVVDVAVDLVVGLFLISLGTGFDVLNVEAQGQRQIRVPVPHRPEG